MARSAKACCDAVRQNAQRAEDRNTKSFCFVTCISIVDQQRVGRHFYCRPDRFTLGFSEIGRPGAIACVGTWTCNQSGRSITHVLTGSKCALE